MHKHRASVDLGALSGLLRQRFDESTAALATERTDQLTPTATQTTNSSAAGVPPSKPSELAALRMPRRLSACDQHERKNDSHKIDVNKWRHDMAQQAGKPTRSQEQAANKQALIERLVRANPAAFTDGVTLSCSSERKRLPSPRTSLTVQFLPAQAALLQRRKHDRPRQRRRRFRLRRVRVRRRLPALTTTGSRSNPTPPGSSAGAPSFRPPARGARDPDPSLQSSRCPPPSN